MIMKNYDESLECLIYINTKLTFAELSSILQELVSGVPKFENRTVDTKVSNYDLYVADGSKGWVDTSTNFETPYPYTLVAGPPLNTYDKEAYMQEIVTMLEGLNSRGIEIEAYTESEELSARTPLLILH